jgi:hypothetical protein
MQEILSRAGAQDFPRTAHCGYCATPGNQRKTNQTQGKTVNYPLVSPGVAHRKIFTGGTATGL